jgi:hypothetical protein
MSTMYEMFATDEDAESAGIYIDYGDFRVKLARAGGRNRDFARVLNLKTKPYKRAIQTETMDNKVAERIMLEVYAETVIRGWETQVDGEWVSGLTNKEGELIPFNQENVRKALTDLPDLFADLQSQAQDATLYRETILEADSGN